MLLHFDSSIDHVVITGTLMQHNVNTDMAFLLEAAKFDLSHNQKNPCSIEMKLNIYDYVREIC